MPLPKSKKMSGLGKAMIRDRFKGRPPKDNEGALHTTDLDDGPSWVKLQSVTQEGDLDAFLSTAQLAGTEFTAEKLNIKVVTNTYQNPFLLSVADEKEALKKHAEYQERLTVPRRPKWDKSTTPEQLKRQERDNFLAWRRDLAFLQEEEGLLMTPFERNLEVWRQLWRVIERSHLVVQIVDARNPLLFRSTDLEKYVKEVDPRKKNLLLVNKADLLTTWQRHQWANYFDSQGIRYTFFSATLAKEKQEEDQKQREKSELFAVPQSEGESEDGNNEGVEDRDVGQTTEAIAEARIADDEDHIDPEDVAEEIVDNGEVPEEEEEEEEEEEKEKREKEGEEEDDEEWEDSEEDDSTGEEEVVKASGKDKGSKRKTHEYGEAGDDIKDDERTRIRTETDLLDLMITEAPKIEEPEDSENPNDSKLMIGLVGYPNVGKSSTINALIGEKRVSVSSTPGKTKHFQTIHLTPTLVLCDCPGLVFPSFATTKADMVCNGVLPIDQLREFTGPATLVAQRIPKEVLEAIYGFKIRTRPAEEGGDGVPTGEELLIAYAIARGFTKSSQGNPDESRAARYILKDYVNGKLLYGHPPPPLDPKTFNAEVHDLDQYLKRNKKQAPVTRVPATAINYILPVDAASGPGVAPTGIKGAAVDSAFFVATDSAPKIVGKYAKGQQGFSRVTLYPHQRVLGDDGTPVNPGGRRERLAMAQAGAETEVAGIVGKRHKKGKRHIKVRSGAGYDL